jgi:replicative DNA helicase
MTAAADPKRRTHHAKPAAHAVPADIEMEQNVLGCLMMAPAGTLEVVTDAGLTDEAFYRPEHRKVFAAVVALAERNVGIDEKTVGAELQRRGQLVEVGGKVALYTMAQRVPAIANAKAYVHEVIDQAKLRRLTEIGADIARMGYERPGGDDPDALWSRAAELVAEAPTAAGMETRTLASLLPGLYDTWIDRHERKVKVAGLRSGYSGLDSKLGGFLNGRLYLVAGRPAMGKTSWAMNVAENVAVDGTHALVFNMEMRDEQLASRVVSGQSRVDAKRLLLSSPVDADFPPLLAAIERLTNSGAADRLHLKEVGGATPVLVRTVARRLARRLERRNDRLGLIVVDYLQLMQPGRRVENEQAALTIVSRELANLAMELDVPVIAVSQLNREVERRNPPRPMLSDLRGSGSLEQDASAVLLLYRPDYYKLGTPETEGRAEVQIAKARDGEIGEVWLDWLGKYTRFEDPTPRRVPSGTPGAATVLEQVV